MNLTDICRTFHPISIKNIFFTSPLGTVLKIDHITEYKENLFKFKCIEIISTFFLRDFHYKVYALTRQTERDIETESEKSPPRGDGHPAIHSPPFSSRDLGHARTRAISTIFSNNSEIKLKINYEKNS